MMIVLAVLLVLLVTLLIARCIDRFTPRLPIGMLETYDATNERESVAPASVSRA